MCIATPEAPCNRPEPLCNKYNPDSDGGQISISHIPEFGKKKKSDGF